MIMELQMLYDYESQVQLMTLWMTLGSVMFFY